MPVKESSDELNPTEAISTPEIAPQKRRSGTDYLALAFATFGVGYLPIAPGTIGSLVGVGLYLAIWTWTYRWLEGVAASGGLSLLYVFAPQFAIMLVVIFVVSMAGIWAASRTERVLQKKDPSIVVVDEIAGQMIALLAGPFWIHTWWSVLSAFLLFRLFDIWKPYPLRRLEGLESGLGIMADDVLAGVYALIVNSTLTSIYLLVIQ
jgi:phosphatidylglycerophosphatase A